MVERSNREAEGSRPVPDPTLLTTEALNREIATIKELLSVEIKHRGDLTDTQFRNVDDRLEDLAARTEEQKSDTKAAVDAALVAAEKAVAAALAAAKEAVSQQTEASERSIAKSETATSKQIDALGALLSTTNSATDDKFSDVKSRLDRIESAAVTQVQAATSGREHGVDLRGWIALGFTAILVAVAVMGFVITQAVKP